MKVMTIGIKTEKEAMKEFKEAFAAAQSHTRFKSRKGGYFTSLGAARNFLTPKRLELLHIIKEKNPHSIYELAKLSHRNFPSVLKDMEILARHGLVQLNRSKITLRETIHPIVNYDAIHLWIEV